MKWQPFTYEGEEFLLEHLAPFEIVVVQEAKANKPKREYHCYVEFSMHCFTRKRDDSDKTTHALNYSDSRETRVFCFDRYEYSKKLKGIISSIGNRKSYHTGHGNYFIVELLNNNGDKEEYEIYFTVSKSGKRKGKLNLYIQSAYIRDKQHNQLRRKRKPIGFQIIAFNTLNNKLINPPK